MQTKIDTSEHPSWWYIFEPRFLARTIQLARSYIDKNMPDEVPTTSDREMDRLLQMQPANFWLTVTQMAELCQLGFPLDLVEYNDSLKVYTYVQNHLETAMRSLMSGMNAADPETLEDLMVLEEFAGRVFAHARFLMGKVESGEVSMISGLTLAGLGENSIFKAASNKTLDSSVVKATTEEDDGYPKRTSFASQISMLQAKNMENGAYRL